MKVLVLSGMYPTPDNPAKGIFVKEQVDSLRELGVSVDVLPIKGKRGKLKYVYGMLQFLFALRGKKYDLIHAHHVYCGVIARLQPIYPVVLTHHGMEVIGEGPLLSLLCRLLSRLVQGVIVTSPELYKAIDLHDARVIPCGVDLNLFHPISRCEARRTIGLSQSSTRYILFTGHFEGVPRREKRLDIIQAAVNIAQENDPDIELLIISRVPHNMMPYYINASNVVVMASDYEGSPMIIKETMACNIPIVSVRVGDVADVISDTDGCYLCERTPGDMATKIGLALSRPLGRTNGREHIQHLSLQATADKLMNLYSRVVLGCSINGGQ